MNRNKRSVAVDLKQAEGREIVHKLAALSDVVVESFGTGVVERLQVDYETIRRIRPDVIYCSISGFGRTGPLRSAPGYDVILQAYSGIMSMTGEKGSNVPIRIPISPVDQTTGLHAYAAILARLFERQKTGIGCRIEVSLYETAIALLGYSLQTYWEKGTLPEKNGSGHESLCPYQAFETADQPILLGVANDRLWHRFCNEAGLNDAADDPRFRTNPARVANFTLTIELVQEALRARSCESWVLVLGAVGIPCAPINTFADLMADPHAAFRGMFPTWERPDLGQSKTVAFPVTVDGQKPDIRSAPPVLGANTSSVMAELGYTPTEIALLGSKGVVSGMTP